MIGCVATKERVDNDNSNLDLSDTYKNESDQIKYDENSGIYYINNELIIHPKEGVTKEQIDRLVSQYEGNPTVTFDDFESCIVRFEKEMDYEELMKIINEINTSDIIEDSYENIVIPYALNSIEKSNWADEWDDKFPCWGLDRIDCDGAWIYADRIKKVNVGVIDNQFFEDHEDIGYKELYKNDFQLEIYGDDDTSKIRASHGTHVSGIIAAKFNGKGVCGVSPNSILYCTSDAGDYFTLDKAIYSFEKYQTIYKLEIQLKHLVKNNKCKVINISMGIDNNLACSAANGNQKQLNYIKKIQSMFSKRVIDLLEDYEFIICEAAGNANGYKYLYNEKNNTYSVDNTNGKKLKPIDAKYSTFVGEITNESLKSHYLVVGASSQQDEISDYSQTGKSVDIVAPGDNICSTVTKDGKTSEYKPMSGTSMSCPHVTGVVSMVWGANPKLSGAEVKKIVCSSYNKKIENYPLLNAKLSVEKSLNISKDNQKNTTDKTNSFNKNTSVDWKSSLEDFLYNLPKYAEIEKMAVSDSLKFELIDMNKDNIPEIFIYSISGGGGGCICTSYAYWDEKQYVAKYIDEKDSPIPTNIIKPYEDNETGNVVYISGMFDENSFDKSLDSGSYSSGYFWRNKWSQDIWEFNNNQLVLSKSYKINEVSGFDKLYNPSSYSVEEKQAALDNIREYNREIHEAYTDINLPYCEHTIRANVLICNKYSLSSYHEVMNKESANKFVNAYLNGEHDYSD